MSDNVYYEYDSITFLMKGEEWHSWVKFLRTRIAFLKEKTIDCIRNNNLAEAQKLVAVIDDIGKQIALFNNHRKELESQLDSQKREE